MCRPPGAPGRRRSPRLVAAVATSTVALARSLKTSGRYVASDMIVMPPMEWPASTASWTSVASRPGQVVRQRLDGQRSGASRAQPRGPLVVEHHTVALLVEPAGDREPDLVAAAPAVREYDDGRVRAVDRRGPRPPTAHRPGVRTIWWSGRSTPSPHPRAWRPPRPPRCRSGVPPAGDANGGGAGQEALGDDQDRRPGAAAARGAAIAVDRRVEGETSCSGSTCDLRLSASRQTRAVPACTAAIASPESRK